MKGFDGWVFVAPEDSGWDGTSDLFRGNFLFADSESLGVNRDIRDRADKITYGRVLKASTRVLGKQAPGGDIEFQFRSDDLPHILMAHFQKYIGTNFGGAGSSRFTFVPEKGACGTSGNSFGTGSYTSPAGALFTVSAVKKFFDTTQNNGTNGQWYNSCIVDEMDFTMEAGNDAKVKASFKASRVDAGTPLPSTLNPSSALGSYSTKPSFEHWSATMLFDGGQMDLNKFSLMSKNNLQERNVIGKINPANYKFGRYDIDGSFDLDMPLDGMKYFGSQFSGSSFAITGTLMNAANDWVTFNLPNCRFKPFEAVLKGGNSDTVFALPFKSYESEDGSTAPIQVTVQTTTWGSTPITRI